MFPQTQELRKRHRKPLSSYACLPYMSRKTAATREKVACQRRLGWVTASMSNKHTVVSGFPSLEQGVCAGRVLPSCSLRLTMAMLLHWYAAVTLLTWAHLLTTTHKSSGSLGYSTTSWVRPQPFLCGEWNFQSWLTDVRLWTPKTRSQQVTLANHRISFPKSIQGLRSTPESISTCCSTSDWLSSLQSKMEKLITVSKTKTWT